MGFWLEFFRDKRFSWDFKIANFIMRDYLRNYLATECCVLDDLAKSTRLGNFERKRIERVSRNLKLLMCDK